MWIKPGHTTNPAASITRSTVGPDSGFFVALDPFPLLGTWNPDPGTFFCIRIILPSSMSKSTTSSNPLAGSMTRPPAIKIRMNAPFPASACLRGAGQEVQQRHPNCDPVLDLIEDQ